MDQEYLNDLDSIVLANDRRGISALRKYLPPGYTWQAARFAFDHFERVLITTGFFVTSLGAPETDGPPGAFAIGRALAALGSQVTYVSDRYTCPLLEQFGHDHAAAIEFPIASLDESLVAANSIIAGIRPTLLIAVERCGITAAGVPCNQNGADISSYTARIDSLFEHGLPSIGIGDGGNEIGMGNLASEIADLPGLPNHPAVTRVSSLVIASVSNWGAYGIAAGLSALAGQDLLPKEEDEERLLAELFTAGCYDGVCPTPVCGVDGFTPAENSQVIRNLRLWLTQHLV